MVKIHPTAIISPEAKIDPTVEIGAYTVIEGDVRIEKGCRIGPHVYIEGDTVIGENCVIYPGVIIGTPPQHLKYVGEPTKVIIGENTIIREYVTIHRATAVRGVTKIGKRCFLMAYSHIAHDCVVGDNVILANGATLGGHVEVESCAVVGGLVAIHQYVRIGEFALLGGGAMVSLDVPPYTAACGDRARLYGLNIVGLKRHGFSIEDIRILKRVYRIFFRSNFTLEEAIQYVESNDKFLNPFVRHFVEFVKNTQRGICRE